MEIKYPRVLKTNAQPKKEKITTIKLVLRPRERGVEVLILLFLIFITAESKDRIIRRIPA